MVTVDCKQRNITRQEIYFTIPCIDSLLRHDIYILFAYRRVRIIFIRYVAQFSTYLEVDTVIVGDS